MSPAASYANTGKLEVGPTGIDERNQHPEDSAREARVEESYARLVKPRDPNTTSERQIKKSDAKPDFLLATHADITGTPQLAIAGHWHSAGEAIGVRKQCYRNVLIE
jgi:hypothetical protein